VSGIQIAGPADADDTLLAAVTRVRAELIGHGGQVPSGS